MKNYKQPGEVIDWVNSTGATVAAGSLVLIGTRVGVACVDIANGTTGSVRVEGVCEVDKKSTDTMAQGAQVYLDNTNKNLTTTATDNTLAGYAFAAAGSGATKVLVKLNG